MNFAEIEHVWRSSHNRPSAEIIERDRRRFLAELERRNRGFVVFIAIVIGMLAVITGRAIVSQIGAAPGGGRVDFMNEWGAFLMLGLPWFAVFFFLREHRRARRRAATDGPSISAGIRTLLDEARFARLRLKWVAWLHGAVLAILPVVVFQLRAVGKAGDEILLPAFVIWPLIVAGILVGLWYHDRRKLRPWEEQLRALLKAYE